MLRRVACRLLVLCVLFLGGTAFGEEEPLRTATFHVEGMTCSLCGKAIEKSLGTLEGVRRVEVDRESKRVTVVAGAAVTADRLKEAIETAGGTHLYEAQWIETR
jgi:copper ion binding protein